VETLRLDSPPAHGGIGERVGLNIILAGNVRDGETEGASQLATSPMKRIEPRTAAGIFAAHLADYNLGIGVDVQRLGLERERTLQSLQQRHIFGDVIVLVADPFRDADGTAGAAVNHHPNTRWPWIAQGATVHIGHEV